jgi:hypothetical protein
MVTLALAVGEWRPADGEGQKQLILTSLDR